MRPIKSYFTEFGKCEQGLAAVEFALSIVFMLLLFMGSIELSRCMLIIQKIEKTVATVADVTTQTDTNTSALTTSQMSQLMSAVDDMMSPYSTGSTDPNIMVIVTDITKTGTANPIIKWQYCGGGTLNVVSQLGSTIGGAATLPSTLTLVAGDEVVIGEVFYNFRPLIANNPVIGTFQIYKSTIYVPRLGALTGFSSHC